VPALPAIRYELNRGLNNARSGSALDSGQLAQAQGALYKRGSEEVHWKSGRTAFAATGLGGSPAGLGYAEFSAANGAVSQVVAEAGGTFYRADAGLTGTWVTMGTGLLPAPLGLWWTFANERYYYNDGVSPPWVLEFPGSGPYISTYLHRTAGLSPPTTQPIATAREAGAGAIVLTSATTRTTGDKHFDAVGNFADGDMATYASVTIRHNGGYLSRLFATGFTGVGAGVASDWVLAMTYEIQSNDGGRCTVEADYTTNAGGNYTTIERITSAIGKHTIVVPFLTALDSANIGGRITITKNGDRGTVTALGFDARVYNTDGTGSTDNTVATGLIYWLTEKIDYLGIESIAGPASITTGAFTDSGAVQITLPLAPVNPLTTHYNLYRTVDGGSFPTGTLVGSFPVGTVAATDPGPHNTIASGITYGVIVIAGLIYHRDILPPPGTVMTTYQNLVVVAPTAAPNHLRYSASSYPESFPLINDISMGSDRDDTVMGLAVLSSQLGVFMRGRGRRIDHLPTPTDPTFAVSPEDFAPDHGLESRNGLAYLSPPGGQHSHIAYVSRDGIRITDLYVDSLVTNNLDWAGTVDATALAASRLVNNPAASRLEFYFTPTAAFRLVNGWDSATNGVLWVHYQMSEVFNPSAMRVTVHPANVAGAVSVPLAGTDYTFLMSNGVRVTPSQVFVDEVGTSDAMQSFDTTGTVPRRVQTGQMFLDTNSSLLRTRMCRLIVDTDTQAGTVFTVTVTAGRDDRAETWSRTATFPAQGAVPRWFNMSGQWHQVLLTADGTGTVPPRVGALAWTADDLGELR
jgi:hypothetical protein